MEPSEEKIYQKLLKRIYTEAEIFKNTHIAPNRGKPVFLIRFENIRGIPLISFVDFLYDNIYLLLNTTDIDFAFLIEEENRTVFLIISPLNGWKEEEFPNLDNAIGKFLDYSEKEKKIHFHFGIGRTASNFISDSDEIFHELLNSSKKNLQDNITRWKWTFLNRVITYLTATSKEASIQPTISYDPESKTFSIKGGEVFIGGGIYKNYKELINDIPADQDFIRFELLILEKLILASNNAPGILKFNLSPQALLEIFRDPQKVKRFHGLLTSQNLDPRNIRIELVEKPFEEKDIKLKDVCSFFWNYGISFSADDFGIKNQSHQIVLELGVMIKEFKLDPMSFQFRKEEDEIKFLDNLAFIDYCQHLANHRDAIIVAEAVEDLDTLLFLLEHKIYHFQTNLFCGKITINEYKRLYHDHPRITLDEFIKIYKEIPEENMKSNNHNIFSYYKKTKPL